MNGRSVIVNQSRGGVVCEATEIADNPWTRLRGLLGRAELPPGSGMLLKPAPSIHSAFMRFEFDVLFLDREMKVLRIVERLPPWKVRGAKGSKAVLELSAGEASRRGVQVGDELVVTDGGETTPTRPPAST